MTIYTKDKSGAITKKAKATTVVASEDFCSKVIETSKAVSKPDTTPIKPTKDNS